MGKFTCFGENAGIAIRAIRSGSLFAAAPFFYQRNRLRRHSRNTQALDELNAAHADPRERRNARRRLRAEQPELFEKIDLSDLPDRSPWPNRAGSFIGGTLGALALGYAGKKIQQGFKGASDLTLKDVTKQDIQALDDAEDDSPGIAQSIGRNMLGLLAGAGAGTAAQAIGGGLLMHELKGNTKLDPLNRRQASQWNADKRMVSSWLHRKGISPNVRSNSALAPYVGPHAVPGRTSAFELNKWLRKNRMSGDYSPDSIVNPWNHPGVMMHEGGHIANFHDQKNALRFFLRNDDKADAAVSGLSQYARGVMPFYSQAAGVGLAALGSKDMGRHAWALPLIGAAPLVGEEGLASLRGLNEIRRQRGMGAALAATPGLLKALSTYAAMPAGLSLAAYLMNRMKPESRDMDSKIRRDKKKAKKRNKARREQANLEELTVQTKAAEVDDLPPPRHITAPPAVVSVAEDDQPKTLAEMVALAKKNKDKINLEELTAPAAHELVDSPLGDQFRQQFEPPSALDRAATYGQYGAMGARLKMPKKLKYQLPAAIVQQAAGMYNRKTDAPKRAVTYDVLGTRIGNHVLVATGAHAAPYAKYAPYLAAAMEQPVEDAVEYAQQIEDPALKAAIRGIAENRRNQQHHKQQYNPGWTEESLHGVSTIGSAFNPALKYPTCLATAIDDGRKANDVRSMNRFLNNPYGEAIHFYSIPEWEQGLRHWADSGTSATIGEYVNDLKSPEYQRFRDAVETRRFLRRYGTLQAPKADLHGTIFDPEAAEHVSPETMIRRTQTLGDPKQQTLDDASRYFDLKSLEESKYLDEADYIYCIN